MDHFGRQTDIRWHRRIDRALQLRHERSERRPTALRFGALAVPASQAHVAGVIIWTTHDRANRHQLVHDASQFRQMLANLDARDGRADRPEFAAHFHRRFRLQIVQIQVRWTAGHKDHDHRLMRSFRSAGCFGAQHVGETQPADG